MLERPEVGHGTHKTNKLMFLHAVVIQKTVTYKQADKVGWHTFNAHKYIQPFQISRHI